MPFVLYLLGLAVFAQASSEFMLSGLGPDIARDLGVSIPTAGWLTSAFAVGMIVGAPAIAVLGARWPRRRTLLVTLTVLAGGLATASLNVGAALGPVLGGLAITATDYRAPLWVSALMIGTALCLAVTVQLRARRAARREM